MNLIHLIVSILVAVVPSIFLAIIAVFLIARGRKKVAGKIRIFFGALIVSALLVVVTYVLHFLREATEITLLKSEYEHILILISLVVVSLGSLMARIYLKEVSV